MKGLDCPCHAFSQIYVNELEHKLENMNSTTAQHS